MFGLFRAKCPLDDEARAWVEERWRWLMRSFGEAAPIEATPIEPTPEFFPDAYDATPDAAVAIFDRVRGYMGLGGQEIKLGFFAKRDDPWQRNPHVVPQGSKGAAGVFHQAYGGERPTIRLELAQLRDPTALVATIAHELGHVHLIAHGRLTGEEPDHEPLTDLLTVFLGLGIFSANSVIRESHWQDGGWSGWSVGRLGYLTQEEFAYALALFARVRGEVGPRWARHLCHDVATYFRRSAKFLKQEGWAP